MTTPAPVVPNITMTGKVMTGYQGWFNAAGDGADRGWRHWGGQPPRPGDVTVDMWPDMSETDPDERFATGFKHPRWLQVLPNGDVLAAEALTVSGGIR